MDAILIAIIAAAGGFFMGWRSRQPYVSSLERVYDHLMNEFERKCREQSALLSEDHGELEVGVDEQGLFFRTKKGKEEKCSE